MQKRHATTVYLTAAVAVIFSIAPMRYLTAAQAQPAQAQQQSGPPHEPQLPVGEPSPEDTLPTLRLTGPQAKEAVLDGETFTKEVSKLSPGVPTDLVHYHLRLVHHKSSDTFTGIFERDGVPVEIPYMNLNKKDLDDPILINGDELKALMVVTQAIRDPKQKLHDYFDYDISNHDVTIQRDAKVFHIYADTSIFSIYWPKRSYNPNGDKLHPDLAFVGRAAAFSLRFEVSRATNKILKTDLLTQ